MDPSPFTLDILSNTTPLKYLTPRGLQLLAATCHIRQLMKEEELYTSAHSADKSAYILCNGSINITDETGNFIALVSHPFTLFDDQFVIFDEKRERRAVAKVSTSVMVIPASSIEMLLEDASEMRFAQALGTRLRISLGIASSLSGFEFALRAALQSGSLDIRNIIPAYKQLSPAIHVGANSASLDMAAWSYAVHRLPSQINEIFALVLSVNNINVMNSPNALRGGIPTAARRRTCRMLMPGKAFLLMRPGQSDITDFVTCLCLHTVEALKLRALMKPIQRTMSHLVEAREAIANGANRETVTLDSLSHMNNISEDDKKSLMSMYKDDLLEQLMNICIHRGDFVIYADTVPMEVSECTAAEKWEHKVQAAVTTLTGMHPAEWPTTLDVDIISSNRTSVVDLLSPFLHNEETKRRVMDWATVDGPDGKVKTNFALPPSEGDADNAYYVTAEQYFDAHPQELRHRRVYDSDKGIIYVDELEFTGISVQIIFLDMLFAQDDGDVNCDSALVQSMRENHLANNTSVDRKHHVIVNVDYAFGEQAEHVLWSLLNLFSLSVRSVNVMGKAGGLQGSRGDIMFPTHFIHERGDIPDFRSVDNQDVDAVELQKLAQRCVHVGPMVTIPGTLLQNRRALRLYHTIWASVGLEMEGVYFVQALNKAKVMGIVSPMVKSRFLYYISDLPLAAGASLAKPMTPEELVPPLYAITRIFMVKCLECQSNDAIEVATEDISLGSDEQTDEQTRQRSSTISSASHDSNDGSTSSCGKSQRMRRFRNVCRAVARFKVSGDEHVAKSNLRTEPKTDIDCEAANKSSES